MNIMFCFLKYPYAIIQTTTAIYFVFSMFLLLLLLFVYSIRHKLNIEFIFHIRLHSRDIGAKIPQCQVTECWWLPQSVYPNDNTHVSVLVSNLSLLKHYFCWLRCSWILELSQIIALSRWFFLDMIADLTTW